MFIKSHDMLNLMELAAYKLSIGRKYLQANKKDRPFLGCGKMKKYALLLIVPMFICAIIPSSKSSLQASKSVPSNGLIHYNEVSLQLQWLRTSENTLLDDEGQIFLLGANYYGEQYNPIRDGKYADWRNAEIDATRMEDLGFNTIRLLIFWELIEISQSPSEFTYNATYIELIRQTVETFNTHNIYVILDLHEHGAVNELAKFIPTGGDDTHFADAFYTETSTSSAREHLKRVWLRLSEVFKDYSGVAGYGILNEPHSCSGSSLSNQEVSDYWFGIADYVITALRAAGDKHIAFVNFTPWSRYTGFMSRKLNDDNVVYEEHFYYGINANDCTVANNDYVWLEEHFISDVNAKVTELNIPFIMGEQGFGGLAIHEGDDRDIWLKNVLTISKQSSMLVGWLYFNWGSYYGNPPDGYDDPAFYGRSLISHFSDKPAQVHFR